MHGVTGEDALWFAINPEPKDLKRLDDIKSKSKGNIDKAVQLATTMANKITDRDKCARRLTAADKCFGENSKVSNVFKTRWLELNPIEIKRGELIDEILKAFEYRDEGCFVQIGSLCKIELREGKIFYYEPKHTDNLKINDFAENRNIPKLSEMWLNRHAFEPYDKTDLTNTTKFEFTL